MLLLTKTTPLGSINMCIFIKMQIAILYMALFIFATGVMPHFQKFGVLQI